MNMQDTGLLVALISRLTSKFNRVWAMNVVLLEEVSKISNSPLTELLPKVEQKYAKMALGDEDAFRRIFEEIQNPSPEKTIEDLLKELGETD